MLENGKNWKGMFIIVLLFSVLGISFLNVISSGLAQGTNYELNLTKGTTIFSVETYDEDAWLTTVSNTLNPSHWFGGDANISGAQSKTTIKGWSYSEWGTYDVLFSINPAIKLLNNTGYNKASINETYPNTYWIWNGLQVKWEYTVEEFDEKPDLVFDQIIILENPEDYKEILDDYNTLATQIQNDINITNPIIKATFSNMTGDDLLWQLVRSRFAAAGPIGNYLLAVTDALETENVTARGCSLIFNQTGLNDYTVEFAYGDRGTLTSVIVKDQTDDIIYHIASINSEWIFYMILAIAVASSIGIILILSIRRRKIKRS
ncbi:MAG: hypothetical protein ACFE8M_07665 [Candidatus Hermodarchaeota archaeon]